MTRLEQIKARLAAATPADLALLLAVVEAAMVDQNADPKDDDVYDQNLRAALAPLIAPPEEALTWN